MENAEDTFESEGGLRLRYQWWRPEGEPRTVVAIVHGIGEHGGRFGNIVDYLVPRGHAVYAVDLRGHGRSPGQRGHLMRWSEYREDVRTFLGTIAAREPGRPLFLLGHSMGGLIVLEYLLRHPEGVRGTIISGAPFESVGVATPFLVTMARIMSRLWPRLPLDVPLEPEALCREPVAVARYLEDPLVHRKCSARWATEAIDANLWVKANAAALRVPLLLLHGEEDRINTAAGARGFFEAVTLPDKELYLVPGGYHEPHNDPGHEQVLQKVEAHLLAHVEREQPQPKHASLGVA
ncbi:MAG TPA: lysophospholipase [Myxococcaceae bacterium]|nr:lysophospholipase [Myxococcaceae bacterium]